jgi:hypothetical protein
LEKEKLQMKYYIFGIPESGTNYVKNLIGVNFFNENNNKNDSGHWSWMHNADAEKATANLFQNTPLIFTYRPLSEWLNYLIKDGLQFINQSKLNQYPDYHDVNLLISSQEERWSLPKAIELWTEYHINWIKYIDRTNHLVIDNSKIEEQPYVVDRLSKIQYRLELIKKMPNWTLIEKQQITNHLTDYQLNYVNGKNLKEITNFFER